MPVYHWTDVEERPLNSVIRGRVVQTQQVMACRITAPKGGIVKTHSHPFDQITHMLRGKFLWQIEGEEGPRIVQAGDVMVLPAGVAHGGEVIEEAEYIDIFAPPNPDFQWDK